MGLFSSLFGNKDKAKLEELSSKLGGGQIQHKPSDQVWEWRGSVGGVPTRIEAGGRCVQAGLKRVQDHGSFTLERNLDMTGVSDAAEEAWADTDTVRLFVGVGTYLESTASWMGEEIAAFQGLPAGGAQRLVDALARCATEGVNAQAEEWLLRFAPGASTDQIAEATQIAAAVLASRPTSPTRRARSAGGGTTESDGADWSKNRVTCGYCRCLYLLGPTSKCPNCGGAATR